MRLLVLLILALFLAVPVAAQDNTSGSDDAAEGDATGDAGGADAEPAGPITIEIEGHQQGSAVYFTLKGETQRNPPLRFAPGQQVTFIFTSVSGVHNLNVNGEARTAILGEGETAEIQWTAPESGSVEYWCDPHRGAGMRGRIAVAAPGGEGAPGGEEGSITGATIDLGQFDPACEGRVAPAIVREGIVGAPTLQDYIDACKTRPEGEVKDTHAADLVIPISWALIGLGVVGVVWVHKYYKP